MNLCLVLQETSFVRGVKFTKKYTEIDLRPIFAKRVLSTEEMANYQHVHFQS